MTSMTIPELIAHLKTMGLNQPERENVVATFRDSGQAEALELARSYVAQSDAQISAAKAAAAQLCGLFI
jgi:hypothetical protein